jgi:hypothetical protein
MRFRRHWLLLVVTIGIAGPRWAQAASFYVDGSCAQEGDGRADGCATSTGAAGAFRNPQSCLNAVQPGDVCYIKEGAGAYVTSNGRGVGAAVGFTVRQSGTEQRPITIQNYPGHTPTFAACPEGSSTFPPCDRATFTVYNRSYVRVTGLRIRGLIQLYCEPPASVAGLCTGNELDHLEIVGGYSPLGDGNWSGIWVEFQQNVRVHHNFIHDLVAPGDTTEKPSACIKVFTGINSLYEYNTCDNSNDLLNWCFDDKQDAVANSWRYNYCAIRDGGGVRLQNQHNRNAVAGIPGIATSVSVHHNVLMLTSSPAGHPCVRFEAGGFNGVDIYNNTCVGFGNGYDILRQDDGRPILNVRVWNNVFAGIAERNVEVFDSRYAPALHDFNAYSAGHAYHLGPVYAASLLDFTTRTSYDLRSQELTGFGFTTTAVNDTAFHLTPGSPLAGSGRVGGRVDGLVMDKGAYAGGSACVGSRCTVPAAPPNVRITPSN